MRLTRLPNGLRLPLIWYRPPRLSNQGDWAWQARFKKLQADYAKELKNKRKEAAQ